MLHSCTQNWIRHRLHWCTLFIHAVNVFVWFTTNPSMPLPYDLHSFRGGSGVSSCWLYQRLLKPFLLSLTVWYRNLCNWQRFTEWWCLQHGCSVNHIKCLYCYDCSVLLTKWRCLMTCHCWMMSCWCRVNVAVGRTTDGTVVRQLRHDDHHAVETEQWRRTCLQRLWSVLQTASGETHTAFLPTASGRFKPFHRRLQVDLSIFTNCFSRPTRHFHHLLRVDSHSIFTNCFR